MITVRKSNERGHKNHGWLNSYHTFSFASYQDPNHMNFRTLRVLNEDRVREGQGFGTHPHQDMEIISVVVSGALEHRDSMGNGEVMRAGDIQHMSAGSGVTHSEFNHSKEEPVHFLQIWLYPEEKGITPRYGQRHFSDEEKRNQLRLAVSPDGTEESLPMNNRSRMYISLLDSGKSLRHDFAEGRGGWLQVIEGDLTVNGEALSAGDGAAIDGETALEITAAKDAHFLLFDLA